MPARGQAFWKAQLLAIHLCLLVTQGKGVFSSRTSFLREEFVYYGYEYD